MIAMFNKSDMGMIVSLIAIVISLVALIRTRKFNARLLACEEENARLSKLQRQILEREEEEKNRCEVNSYWYTGENNSGRIAIVNSGAVPAYDIRLKFKPKKGCTSPGIEKIMKEIFPIKVLWPDDKEYFLISRSMSTGSTWPATMYWRNNAGEEFESDIVLGKEIAT